MSIPLVQKLEKDDINTSIIAIKRNIECINMLLGLVDSGSPNLSGFATKQELEDAITQVETDLAPVDEVTVDNMHSVTSNAVANKITETVDYINSNFIRPQGLIQRYFTPQQINDPTYLANEVKRLFENLGYGIILFSVGWEDYTIYPFAGAQGYFMRGVSSARCYGQLRGYTEPHFTHYTYGIDNYTTLSWTAG